MRCPYCRHADSRVVDSREADDGQLIRRRRSCPECGKRFTTVEEAVLAIVKRSGVTEPFSRTTLSGPSRRAPRRTAIRTPRSPRSERSTTSTAMSCTPARPSSCHAERHRPDTPTATGNRWYTGRVRSRKTARRRAGAACVRVRSGLTSTPTCSSYKGVSHPQVGVGQPRHPQVRPQPRRGIHRGAGCHSACLGDGSSPGSPA